MAPRGRSRKPRLSRMDAAIDAMNPFGFSKNVVQRTVKTLLKEYGGDDGWPFIEADAYKVLLEAILSELEKSQQEDNSQELQEKRLKSQQEDNNQELHTEGGNLLEEIRKIEEEGPYKYKRMRTMKARPFELLVRKEGGSSKWQEISLQDERFEDHDVLSAAGSSEVKDCPLLTEGDGKSWKDIGLDQTCSQMEIFDDAGNIEGCSGGAVDLHNTPVHSPPAVIPTPPPVDSLPARRRKPCYGWISDGEEDDFIELTAAITLTPVALGGSGNFEWWDG